MFLNVPNTDEHCIDKEEQKCFVMSVLSTPQHIVLYYKKQTVCMYFLCYLVTQSIYWHKQLHITGPPIPVLPVWLTS